MISIKSRHNQKEVKLFAYISVVVIYLRILDKILTSDETTFFICDINGCSNISESRYTPRYENLFTKFRDVLRT